MNGQFNLAFCTYLCVYIYTTLVYVQLSLLLVSNVYTVVVCDEKDFRNLLIAWKDS